MHKTSFQTGRLLLYSPLIFGRIKNSFCLIRKKSLEIFRVKKNLHLLINQSVFSIYVGERNAWKSVALVLIEDSGIKETLSQLVWHSGSNWATYRSTRKVILSAGFDSETPVSWSELDPSRGECGQTLVNWSRTLRSVMVSRRRSDLEKQPLMNADCQQ